MKTIDEASREYSNPGNYHSNLATDRSKQITINTNSFKAGVEFAQRWISIDDELPKTGTEFLGTNLSGDVTDNDLYTRNGELVKGEKTEHVLFKRTSTIDSECLDILKSYRITHWRPIKLN
jgi:hypothetical protein